MFQTEFTNWRYVCCRSRKKQEEESAEIKELLCQPTNANGMTKRSQRKQEKKGRENPDQKVCVFHTEICI